MKKLQKIGGIGNYYGGLAVKFTDGKYYWGIEDYDKYHWREIPETLYQALINYEEDRQK